MQIGAITSGERVLAKMVELVDRVVTIAMPTIASVHTEAAGARCALIYKLATKIQKGSSCSIKACHCCGGAAPATRTSNESKIQNLAKELTGAMCIK